MMTPERWAEIQNAPHPDWWECSEWIKASYRDLLKEVVDFREQLAEAQRERDEARNQQGMEYGANQDREREIASLRTQLQSQAAQLAETQRERERDEIKRVLRNLDVSHACLLQGKESADVK